MKPLTVEELKALEVGDWVWRVFPNAIGFSTYIQKMENNDDYFDKSRYKEAECRLNYSTYGTEWLAYKNKEQAETKGEIVELPCIIEVQDIDTVRYDIYFKRTKPPYKGSLDFYVRKTREEAEACLKELQSK